MNLLKYLGPTGSPYESTNPLQGVHVLERRASQSRSLNGSSLLSMGDPTMLLVKDIRELYSISKTRRRKPLPFTQTCSRLHCTASLIRNIPIELQKVGRGNPSIPKLLGYSLLASIDYFDL